MKQVWLAYIDQSEGCDREHWSVFYTQVLVADSEAKAISLGEEHSSKLTLETEIDYTYHIEGPLEIANDC